jgi:hypothetical protein
MGLRQVKWFFQSSMAGGKNNSNITVKKFLKIELNTYYATLC